MTDEVLLTTLEEADDQDLVNSSEALTPSCFVNGSELAVEHISMTKQREALRNLYKRSKTLLVDHFVEAVESRVRAGWRSTNVSAGTETLRIMGDQVFIADEGVSRSWTRGMVSELYPGADRRVRRTQVKTAKRESSGSL